MRAVVVHHQMYVQVSRHVGFDGAQELQELRTAMTPVQLPNHLARGNVQRRKQRCCAMAHVVVGSALGDARCQRQNRLSAIQCLNLALFIHAQHHRLERRIKVQAHDVTYLLDEQWIAGEFECLLAVRLQAESPPDSAYSRL